jgi:hypothetical protein
MRGRCIDPHFLDFGTSWRWMVSFTPLPLYPRERALGTHFIGGWVDPRAGLDDMDPTGTRTPAPLVVQPVASRYTDWAISAPHTSTIALRIIGGDKKGSPESETVKYGCESQGTWTREWLCWRGPAAIVNDRTVLSSEHPTSTNPKLSDSSKNLVVNPRWVLYSKTDWPTDPSVVI